MPQPYSPEALDQLSKVRKLNAIIRLEYQKLKTLLSKSGASPYHDIIHFQVSSIEFQMFCLSPRLDDILDSKVPLPEPVIPDGSNPT